MAKILLVTHWTDGDVLPFIEIGKQMQKKQHKVTLITHCYYREKARVNGFEFEAIDTEETYWRLVEDMKQEVDPFGDWERFMDFHKKYESVEVRLSEFEKIARHIEPEQTIIVAKNRSSVAAFLASEKYRVPLVNLFINPVEIPNLQIFNQHFGDQMLPGLNQLRSMVGLEPVASWLAFHSSSKVNIALWLQAYAPMDTQWPAPIHYAGFIVSNDKGNEGIPDALEQVLESNEVKVLITGGTSKMLHPDFLPAGIAACKKAGCQAVVVRRYSDFDTGNLPPNTVWVKEAPFRQVMPRFDLVIHHGGIGTVTNALEAEVPQLILPYYVDRPFNATCVQNLGVGVSVPLKDWTADALADKIWQLKKPEVKAKCMEYAGRIKPGAALGTIEKLIEESFKHRRYTNPKGIDTDKLEQNTSICHFAGEAQKKKLDRAKLLLLKKMAESRKQRDKQETING